MNNDRIPTRPLNAMELAFQRAAQAKHDRAVRNTTPVRTEPIIDRNGRLRGFKLEDPRL